MLNSIYLRLLAVTGVLLIFGLVGVSQETTGDILGTVQDSAGAPIPAVSVTVQNLATHAERTVQSSGAGEYVVNLLSPGQYQITITRDGFNKFTVPGITLDAGDRARVNATLTVGVVTQTVTVQTDVSSLQTDSSVLSNTIVAKAVQDLPLNGRNFVQLVQLQPGVNEGPPDGLNNGGKLDDQRQTASFSVNGQSDALNNQLIDGVDNNERFVGTIGVRPAVEAIGEMHVQTGNYTAEVGRTGGGIINIITKSGANQVHGTVFEFFRNDVLDAYSYAFGQNLPKTELRQNQYGASIGGPIKKDKTFFFGDYEGYRRIQGDTLSSSVVPTLYEEQHLGDFSDRGGPVIPAGQIDPAAAAYFSLYPEPNAQGNDGFEDVYFGGGKNKQNSHIVDSRVDHQFNQNNQFFARFNLNKVFTQDTGSLPARALGSTGLNLYPGFGVNAPQIEYQGMMNYVHTFNPNLLMELKAAYTRLDNESLGLTVGSNANQALGQPNVNSPISGCTGLAPVLSIGVGGPSGALLGNGCLFNPDKDQDNIFQYAGSAVYTHGNHNIKSGVSFIRRQLEQTQSPYGQGLWLFFNLETLLQGQVFQVQQALVFAPPHLQGYEPSIYFQDDWRASKNLTLNMGIRYDIYTPLTESRNRISTFDPVTGQLLVANQNGVSKYAGIALRFHDVAPRFGFAYTPIPNLVIRGGYGIGFAPFNSTSTGKLTNPPFIASGTYNFIPFQNGLPAPTPATLDAPGASVPFGEDPKWQESYFQQFNLTVQKDFSGNVVTMSYVGLLGRQLLQYLPDLNAPLPNGEALGSPQYQALRPYYAQHPNLTTVGFSSSVAASSYNSYQASFERRLRAGLTLNANYSLAHNLDNATGLSEEGAAGYGAIPSQTSTIDYGNNVLDVRNRIAGTANYELPFGKNSASPFVRTALGGWQVNLINVWTTGPAFTVLNGNSVSNTVSGGSDRPNQIGSFHVSNPTVGKFFNTDAFQSQPAGTYGAPAGSPAGTIGTLAEHRNQLHGPHYRHLDVSLFKTFDMTERFKLEFRAEAFNLTNTANFGVPQAVITSSTFGQLTSLLYAYTPREIQFAAKLRF